eukprot:15355497-Ditylum_brightwellii.AAC.1
MAAMQKSIDELTAVLKQLKYRADTSAGLGVTTEKWHTSKNCKKPKAGHKENATYYNRMGGSDNKPPPYYRRRS